MKNTFKFNIKGQHESHTGEAQVLDPNESVQRIAGEQFEEMFPEHGKRVSIRYIGNVEHERTVYQIFESYIDSGSVDYIYFATPQYQVEI